jgi:hypothetical protein
MTGDPFDAAWQEVESRWAEDAAHKKFIAFCAAQNALQEAGRRYRAVRDADPERKAAAEQHINSVLARAIQTIDMARTDRPARVNRLQWVALGVSVFFILYALLSVLRSPPQ